MRIRGSTDLAVEDILAVALNVAPTVQTGPRFRVTKASPRFRRWKPPMFSGWELVFSHILALCKIVLFSTSKRNTVPAGIYEYTANVFSRHASHVSRMPASTTHRLVCDSTGDHATGDTVHERYDRSFI